MTDQRPREVWDLNLSRSRPWVEIEERQESRREMGLAAISSGFLGVLFSLGIYTGAVPVALGAVMILFLGFIGGHRFHEWLIWEDLNGVDN